MRRIFPARIALAFDAAAILLAGTLMLVRPSSAWLAGPYALGFYGPLQRAVTGATNLLPFAAGDVFAVAVFGGIAWLWIARLRRERTLRSTALLLLRTAAIAGLLYAWFLIAWGWNYTAAPLAERLGYDGGSLQTVPISRIEDKVVDALDALAPQAHAEHERDPDARPALARSYQVSLGTLHVAQPVRETNPKRSIVDPYFVATGIAGLFFPFTFETYLASDVLWFEYPFNLAHEWGHLAGIARESDANFVGAVTTLRSEDPVLRYSGLLIVYGAMPRIGRSDKRLSKLVLRDYDAMRRRDDVHIKRIAFNFAWRTYDKYLKSQHIASGVINYSQYIQLLLGTKTGREALERATATSIKTNEAPRPK